MTVTLPKLLALAIALGYFIAALVLQPGVGMLITLALLLLLPLSLIWLPEKWNGLWPRKKSILGFYSDPHVPYPHPAMRESAPGLIAFMGWFFLVGIPLIVYWIWNAS